MLLGVLDRPGDGCAALRHLLTDNHESRPAQRRHIRSAIAMYRSLLAAGALERLETPDQAGRRVRVTEHLQADFALNQPLGPFILDVLPRLDDRQRRGRSTPSRSSRPPWRTRGRCSPPSSTGSAPRRSPGSKPKASNTSSGWRSSTSSPGPNRSARSCTTLFDAYRIRHPWAADFNVNPKSVVRDMFERALGFSEYVALYGLARSEGLVLRYLTDAYRGLVQSVPEDAKTDELVDITEWLGELVRQVDSSLLDEWEALTHPDQTLADLTVLSSGPAAAAGPIPTAVTANTRAFMVMVRNAAFHHVELLARRDFAGLGDLDGTTGWDAARGRRRPPTISPSMTVSASAATPARPGCSICKPTDANGRSPRLSMTPTATAIGYSASKPIWTPPTWSARRSSPWRRSSSSEK